MTSITSLGPPPPSPREAITSKPTGSPPIPRPVGDRAHGPQARLHGGKPNAPFRDALARLEPSRGPTDARPTPLAVGRRVVVEGEPARDGDRARSPRPRLERGIERDPGDSTELQPFRVAPLVLQPPPDRVALRPELSPELTRLAEQLVTRLRVGRSREGALVELRLSLGDRELDVTLREGASGIVLETDAEPALRRAIERELAARGVGLERS